MFLELERTLRRSKIATKYIYIHGPVCVDTSPPDTIKVNPLRPAGGVNTDVFDSSARSEPTAFVFILPGATQNSSSSLEPRTGRPSQMHSHFQGIK